MKRLIICILIFCMLFIVMCIDVSAVYDAPPASQLYPMAIYKVALWNMRFREGPSTAYTIIGILNMSEHIGILNETYRAPWEYGIPYSDSKIYEAFQIVYGYIKNEGGLV